MLRQLIHPKTFKNSVRIDKLKNKIDQLEYVAEKEWLLEKLGEMG